MKKIKFIILNAFLIIITAIFAFAAEGENNIPLSSSVPETSPTTQPQTQQQTLITQTSENAYSYNPLGKQDPFRPFVEIDTITKKKDEKKDTASIFPLQRIATENFRVVGIIGDKIRRVAVVEDATKKFYPLFTGTHMGLHNGKVIEIMADRVIVEEYETNKAKRIILKLRKN